MTYFGIFCWNKLSRMTPFGIFRGVKLSQFGLKFAKVSSFKVCDTIRLPGSLLLHIQRCSYHFFQVKWQYHIKLQSCTSDFSFFNWDSLCTRFNSQKEKHKKIKGYRKPVQKDLKPFRSDVKGKHLQAENSRAQPCEERNC